MTAYDIEPYISTGPLRFGMNYVEVRRLGGLTPLLYQSHANHGMHGVEFGIDTVPTLGLNVEYDRSSQS